MSAVAQTAEDVLIHVRFQPNAEVWTIDNCPEGVSPKARYERLLAAPPLIIRPWPMAAASSAFAATFAGIAAK